MVWPLTFTAANPVGAKTTTVFLVVSRKCLRRVDFPVPAWPVMKALWPFSIRYSAFFASSESNCDTLRRGINAAMAAVIHSTTCGGKRNHERSTKHPVREREGIGTTLGWTRGSDSARD